MQTLKNRVLVFGLVGSVLLAFEAAQGQERPELSQRPVRLREADSAGNRAFDAMLWRGIDAMYSYRFHEAADALDSVMAADSDNTVAPFVAVANQWLMSLTEESFAASHGALLDAIDATIPRYDKMISRHGHRADILLFLGSTYGLRARVHLAEKNWFAVLYSGLKGWSLVHNAHEQDSTLADAYLPIGIFDYYAGMSSTAVQLLARMFGINPDRQGGIEILQKGVQLAPYAWIEAASTLSIIYLYIENEPELAYRYTDLLIQHYPANYYFNFLMGEELVRSRRLPEARAFMPRLEALFMQSHPNQRLEWALKYASLEAALAFEEGELDTSMERCQWVIDNYDMEFDWHLGFAHYIRGQILESRGNLTKAREDYRFVANLDNKTYAVDEAKAALRRLDQIR
ncbi:MAG: hypothetical protein JSW54_10820 [Fidelibacterota bacterium]|nr:MAG: hypothetical protein JSW54_10820 [Candidatus Neomarinimicrobiota bacterium]